MSYILEALKRADAERDRGAVPTLHSHAMPAAPHTPKRTPIANWIAAIALLALVVLGALWWTLGRQPAQVVLAPVTMPPAPLTPTAPAVVAAAPAAPVAPDAVTPPRPAKPSPPSPPAAPRKAAEPPRAVTPRPAASAVAAAATTPAPNPAPRASATTQGVIYNVAELPDDIRAQLPKLSISGATYSAQAAYRMLIVNGQVLHENDEPAPGLTLETIRQKDVVLRFKGYRYSVAY